MSSSRRFSQLVDAAYRNNDRASMLDAYYNWQDTNCLHPVSVRVVDNHTQTKRTIQVPCGRCWHCQQSKINEWCTRMYAHAEDFKNVYFVTLTYKSISTPELPVAKLFLAKLGQAVWHKDSLNQNFHLSYNPCLLVKKHYQDFLKRLRKNTGLKDLTYIVSGEYGHKFGRPHFHLILFTNGVLTRSDVQRAWSVCLWKSNRGEWSYRTNQRYDGVAYDVPIGRVDFNDLVQNGTMNKGLSVRVDGTYMNASNCFAYVCKYVVKRDNANLSRLKLAYDNLFHKETVVDIGSDSVRLYQIRRYLTLGGFTYNLQTINDLKHLSYEKVVYQPSACISQYGLLRSKRVQKQNYSYDLVLLPDVYHEFCDSFRPFCEFSRGTPIGSLYAKRNIQEFTQGVFTKPLLQDKGFIVPRYFRNKAQEYSYGLRKLRKSIKGQSLVITGLVDLLGRFQSAYQNNVSLSEDMGYSMPYSYITEALQDDRRSFVDAYTKERIILYNGFAQHYKFDRHTRNYEFTRAISVPDWIRSNIVALQNEMKRASIARKMSTESHRLSDRAILLMNDSGFDLETMRNTYMVRQESVRKDMDLLYHSVHNSAE